MALALLAKNVVELDDERPGVVSNLMVVRAASATPSRWSRPERCPSRAMAGATQGTP